MSNNCKVTFRRDGEKITIDCPCGQTLLDSARENDVQMDNACGGNGVCTTCMVRVKSGVENLSPMTDCEEMMGLDPEQPEIRLGCQCQANGECDVEIAY